MSQGKIRKKKLVLVFDENARREFLTGFHKRKVERKTKAAEELKKQLKIEKKRIRAQTKLAYQKLTESEKFAPVVNSAQTEEIDMGEHSISITELSQVPVIQTSQMFKNQVQTANSPKKLQKVNISSNIEDVEGMELICKSKTCSQINQVKVLCAKDFKKAIKMEATNHVQKSKAFRTRSKVAQIKNLKLQRREERKRQKLCKKGRRRK